MPVPEPVSVTTTLTAADYSSAIRTMLLDRYGWFKRAAFVFSVGFLFYIACALYLKSDDAGRLFPATVILFLLILPFWIALTPYFSAGLLFEKTRMCLVLPTARSPQTELSSLARMAEVRIVGRHISAYKRRREYFCFTLNRTLPA
jgi:hypothetical protein